MLISWVFSPLPAALREDWGGAEPGLSILRVALMVLAITSLARCEKAAVRRGAKPLWPGRSAVLQSSPLLWVLLGMSFLSLLWSARPELTAFRLCGLGTMVALGWYISRRLNYHDLARVLAWSSTPLLAVSFVAVLVNPELATHGERPSLHGAWRGLLGHRNALALFATLTALSLASLSLWGRGMPARLSALGAILALAMLWPVGSATGFVVSIVCLVLIVLGRCTDNRPGGRVAALYMLAAVGFVALLAVEPLLAQLGRGPTLSGRTIIWEYIIEFVSRRPLTGYGYGLFWPEVPALQPDLASFDRPWQRSIHSGYLATAFWLGWPGLLVLFAFIVRLLFLAGRVFVFGEPGLARIFPMTLLAIIVLHAIPEARMLHHGDFMTAVLCALAFRLHLAPSAKSPTSKQGTPAEAEQ